MFGLFQRGRRRLAWLLLVALLAGAGGGLPLRGQTFLAGQANDVFRRVGFDTNGVAWLIGTRGGVPTVFERTALGFNTTTLSAGPGLLTFERGISRDAKFVVGIAFDEEAFVQFAVLWNRTDLNAPMLLPDTPGFEGFSAALAVASTTSGYVVGGDQSSFGTLWTPSGPQITSTALGIQPAAVADVSGDGQAWVGYRLGINTRPFFGSFTSTSILPTPGNTNGVATEISPNARFIGGMLGDFITPGQSLLWEDRTPRLLTLGGAPLLGPVQGVSDSGFAVVRFNGQGWLYDPRTGVASVFDTWWLAEYGTAVPHHVTNVNDLYECNGKIYFSLATTAGAALAYAPAPAPLRLEIIRPVGAGAWTIRFPTRPGFRYTLQHRAVVDSGPWQDGAFLTGDGALRTLADTPPPGTAQRFYRVQVGPL